MRPTLSLLFTVFTALFHLVKAQGLTILEDSLHFQPTDFGDTVVGSVTVINSTSLPVTIKSIQIGKAFNDNAFTLNNTPTSIPPGTTHITVRFHPQNDIYYRVPLIIQTENGNGDYSTLLCGQGKFDFSIGQHTENKSGLALKQAMAAYQSNHTNLGYNGARDLMYSKLDNIGGWVTCLYTARMAQFTTRAGAIANDFNAEHVFPQSFFNQNDPMRSDLNHLYSTDETANNIRSNYPFGIITGSPSWQVNGSKYLSGVFEPRDSAKGRVARALLYFVLRYQDYSNFVAPQEILLREWHFQHLPDAMDRRRDSIVDVHQGRHNILIRYPYVLNRINSLTGSADFPNVKNFKWSSDTIHSNSTIWPVFFSLWNQGYHPLLVDSVFISVPNPQFTIEQMAIPAFTAARCTLTLPSTLPSGVYEVIAYSGTVQKKMYLSHTPQIGLSEIVSHTEVKLYPNPADESLEIQAEGPYMSLEIINLQGISVLKSPFTNSLSIKNLPAGLYILILKDEFGNQFANRFVVFHR
ncbi:MAG: endonuclease [Thermaurantimonas sp.]